MARMAQVQEVNKELLVKTLKNAEKILEREENWTRGSFARTKEEYSEHWKEPKAHSFCLKGALLKGGYEAGKASPDIYHNHIHYVVDLAEAVVSEEILDTPLGEKLGLEMPGEVCCARFNDSKDTSHQDVLDILRSARIVAEDIDIEEG